MNPGDDAPLGVAIVGAGVMAEVHARALAASPRLGRAVRFVARRPAPARRLAELHGGRAGTSLEEALADEAVEAVVVATPTATHPELVGRALDAGKHVLVEKPLALGFAEGERLLKRAEKSDRLVMVAHCVRWFHEVRALLERLAALGTPRTARATRVAGWPGGWYVDAERSGGVCFDLMVHDFDLLRWWFGDVVRVHALAAQRRPEQPETYAQVSLRHATGVISYVEGSWLHPDGFATGLEVSGSEGLLRFSLPESKPLRFVPLAAGKARAGGAEIPESPFRRSPYDLQMEAFLHAVRNGGAAPVGVRDGLAAVAIAEAARRSIATGRPQRPKALPAPAASRSSRRVRTDEGGSR